jgi:SAM-dependent methyltransferase
MALLDPALFDLLHMFLRTQMPLLPEGIDPGQLTTILDVGCGQQQWGKDLCRLLAQSANKAWTSSGIIEGIERDEEVVRQANRDCRASRGKVITRVGDMFHMPKDFTRRYDLVHLRCLSPWVADTSWPDLLRECARVCKPGGWVIWIEPASPVRTERTPAWNQWMEWIEQAMQGHGGSPHITQRMEALFRQIGAWKQVGVNVTSIRLRTASSRQGSVSAREMQRLIQPFTLLYPYLLTANVAPSELLDKTRGDVHGELAHRQLETYWHWYAVWGRKR